MGSGIFFPICAIPFSLLIILLFFFKGHIENRETKIYGLMIIVNIIGLVFEILCTVGSIIYANYPIASEIIYKVYLVCLITWTSLITLYIYVVSTNSKKEIKIKLFYRLFLLLCVIITFLLPIELVVENNFQTRYTIGPSVNFTYIMCGILIFLVIISLLKNYRSLKNKKYIPVYAFLVIGTIAIIIQMYNPQILMITYVEAFIDVIMYFTIENPDMKMIEQLNMAKASAEKANRAKTDFLSSMSHEIRTPLNAIVGFSEMIENEVTIEGCKENAKDIVLASQTLLEIVNGILDISKIEANKMEIVNKEYELLPELKNLSKLILPRIGEKPIILKTQFAPDIPAVMYGDIGKIKQIITNILINAVKYTEQGEINFVVNCVNENDICSLIISVEDTGRGIESDKIDSLFTKFNRLDEDKNTTIEGTGLGLAITKSLTEMMGGKIIVQSVYGSGSKFTIYLNQKIVKQEGHLPSEVKNENVFDFKDFKILIVDDNKLNLKVADKLLKSYFLTTTLVDSGIECLNLINNGEKYDLILMDDMMPELKGSEVLEKLREIPGFTIPVVALTANATTGIKEQYLNIGFNDYLAKPINKLELVEVLTRFLKENKLEVKKANAQLSRGKKKVLIVDDNKMNIKIAANLMKEYDFEIEEAMSGLECIDKVKNKKYDLIFMDYMMPEMDGIETLKHLKSLPNFNTTAIALTADAVEGSREKFLNAGFDEYVSKPIIKDILDQVIVKMLNKNLEKTEQDLTNKIEYLKQNEIDIDNSLQILGDIETYNETLNQFIYNMNNKFNKIKTYRENNDMINYAIEVHSLKIDSDYLGFTKLAEISYEHEMKSKENNIEFINNNFNELLNETARIFNVIKKYLF